MQPHSQNYADLGKAKIWACLCNCWPSSTLEQGTWLDRLYYNSIVIVYFLLQFRSRLEPHADQNVLQNTTRSFVLRNNWEEALNMQESTSGILKFKHYTEKNLVEVRIRILWTVECVIPYLLQKSIYKCIRVHWDKEASWVLHNQTKTSFCTAHMGIKLMCCRMKETKKRKVKK